MTEQATTTRKGDVLAELGEQPLLLPALVGSALAANDQAKYLLSLLQAARERASSPSAPYPSLRDERLAAGIRDPGLDTVVAGSREVAPGLYLIPGAQRLHQDLVGAIRQMLAPLATAAQAETDPAAPGTARLDALLADAPDLRGDEVPGAYIDQITSARRDGGGTGTRPDGGGTGTRPDGGGTGTRPDGGAPGVRGDSLHLLVMDAHRELNRLQARIATASVDGAAVYRLAPGDEELVAAFMAGVHETAPLKFDHPGLSTTATRTGDRVAIQNDLGTTSAHVVVVAVEGLVATVTYTDVHRRRLEFFCDMLGHYAVTWASEQRRAGTAELGEHHVATGRYEAPDRAGLKEYLRYLGSRLVFVLDWNRARKRIASFLGQPDAISVLRWAADRNLGHMAFLVMGGERLLYDAIEFAARTPARYGEPLVDVLGREATLEVTRFALRAAAEGMLGGKSHLLIRDELRVEVLRHVHASQSRLLQAGAEHASLIVETAQALHNGLLRLGTADAAAFLGRLTRRAAGWEHRADQILIGQRQAARRVDGGDAVAALTAGADDAIDDLEEVVFLLTLIPPEAADTLRPILEPVTAVAAAAAREHLKAVEAARQVIEGSAQEDLEDFLVAVDQVASLEHEADTADRMARAALVTAAPEFRSLYVADSASRGAEDATDAMLRSALGLRDHVLGLLGSR